MIKIKTFSSNSEEYKANYMNFKGVFVKVRSNPHKKLFSFLNFLYMSEDPILLTEGEVFSPEAPNFTHLCLTMGAT